MRGIVRRLGHLPSISKLAASSTTAYRQVSLTDGVRPDEGRKERAKQTEQHQQEATRNK
jgi:hypothetical protein